MWALLFIILFQNGWNIEEGQVTLGRFIDENSCQMLRRELIKGRFYRTDNLKNVKLVCINPEKTEQKKGGRRYEASL